MEHILDNDYNCTYCKVEDVDGSPNYTCIWCDKQHQCLGIFSCPYVKKASEVKG